MKLSASLATFALLAPSALAAYLPACSGDSILPCKCPSGTSYRQSSTYAVIGAAVTDITALISDFFKTDWVGFLPEITEGPNNKPGVSVRGSLVPTDVGSYTLFELLTELSFYPRGSSVMRFEQLPSTIPVEYKSGNGSFSGFWVRLETKLIFQYETAITWKIYACETGIQRDFGIFYREALNNLTSVLEDQGKLNGRSVAPISIE